MKTTTLINPAGESKELTDAELLNLQTQFANSKRCKEWSERQNIALWIKGRDNHPLLGVSAVNKFLVESGYKIIDNLHK